MHMYDDEVKDKNSTRKEGDQLFDGKTIEHALLENSQMVYNIALKFMGNSTDAKDVAQDSLLKAYQNRHSFRGNSAFSTWMYTITVNTCKDFLRRKKVQIPYEPKDMEMLAEKRSERSSRTATNPAAYVEKKEMLTLLRLAIAELPVEYKEVIMYREYLDMSYQEIAEKAGISLGTVKSRLSRAKERLAKNLQERLGK